MSGTLYLVGVGPGDPDLLTLKAARLLAAVPVIAFPTTAENNSMAFTIARAHVGAAAQLLPIMLPMAVARLPAQTAYDGAGQMIQAHLDAGRDVAYLCEGDPLFYGSAMYLLERIVSPVVVIPGITSLTAAAAAIVRPLAARNEVLKILPAPLADDILRAELISTPAAAIIKIGRHFDRVRDLLQQTGHAANAMVIEHATGTGQRITPLRNFDYGERPYFSIILCYRGEEAWAKP